jgi:hypothetical protein
MVAYGSLGEAKGIAGPDLYRAKIGRRQLEDDEVEVCLLLEHHLR